MNRNSLRPSTVRPRRAVLTAAGIAAGCVLAVAAPLAASAHVEVDPAAASAGGTTRLTFRFHHGCDGSPTTALVVSIPKGAASATPVYDGGWKITRTLGANGLPTQVTYTATQPIPTDTAASVAVDVLFGTGSAGESVSFPVVQKCETGSISWTQIPKAGQDPETMDSPAPTVTVGAAVAEAESGHGASAAPSASTSPEHTATADAGDHQSVEPDPVARWLAAGGLVAGIAALVVSLVRRRK